MTRPANISMRTDLCVVLLAFVLLTLFVDAGDAFDSRKVSGDISWAFGCDFPDHDETNMLSTHGSDAVSLQSLSSRCGEK